MNKVRFAWFLIFLTVAALIFSTADAHHKKKKSKSKGRGRRYFFDETCPELCLQDVAPGNCSMWLHKYYFNPITLTCTKFLYTGCGKNSNSFETLPECQATCGGCGVEPPPPLPGSPPAQASPPAPPQSPAAQASSPGAPASSPPRK